MSILVLTSDTLIGTAATGNIEYNGQFYGTDSNASRARLQRIAQGTAVASTSGTSIDFTSIPSWAERITVMFAGVSGSGTSNFIVQLGTSGGLEITTYLSNSARLGLTSNDYSSATTGLNLTSNTGAGNLYNGIATINNITSNTWVHSAVMSGTGSQTLCTSAGYKVLSGTLDRIRITTVNGTDTFDTGTVNIMYEG